MDLNEIAVFVKVVQLASFSRAANRLGMPNSTVSAKIASLEKRLGVTLIQRTTRRMDVTATGQAYFEKCVQGIAEIDIAESEIAIAQGEPQGILRITAPIEFGNTVLPLIVSEFTRQHPKVNVEILLTDRCLDLRSDNMDLAIRAGDLKDSTLIAKKIGAARFALYAAPSYLRAHGSPAHPRDLRRHDCLQFPAIGRHEWALFSDKGSTRVAISGRVVANDMSIMKLLALKGDGIALLPTYYCQREVASTKLVRVLPQWRSRVSPVHFVYPPQKFDSPKRTAFMALALDPLRRSFEG